MGSDPISAPFEPTLDHALLIAGAAVNQASTPTAELAGRLARQQVQSADHGQAARVSHGSFHPRIARATAGKASSTFMKPGFTLAF
jgi:hypothetical protein